MSSINSKPSSSSSRVRRQFNQDDQNDIMDQNNQEMNMNPPSNEQDFIPQNQIAPSMGPSVQTIPSNMMTTTLPRQQLTPSPTNSSDESDSEEDLPATPKTSQVRVSTQDMSTMTAISPNTATMNTMSPVKSKTVIKPPNSKRMDSDSEEDD
ncbi:unnamed protein product [Brachionus calyciflorus]|uniref:Uncharacterized protein n=1 Tax=Brachionus calyciflorus TaxID=104777 RepID=A0A813MVG5_9BILA|nr:unnamed protein product [Brachionus calyciflorus]